MKYCVPYYRNFKYMKDIDEIIIPFNNSLAFFKTLIERKQYLYNSKIILEIQDTDDFYASRKEYYPILIDLQTNYEDLHIKLMFDKYYASKQDLYEELKSKGIEFFFSTYVRDWDAFYGLISIGVSDIYIVESLAFELNLLGPVAHASGVSIRVFANVCQASWIKDNTLKSFFIRPEDVSIYEPFVDVIEFYGNQRIQEVMYKIYAKDGKWFGDLREIINGLEIELDSRHMLPAFAEARVACGKKCLKGKSCRICDRILETSQTMKEHDLIIKIQKSANEDNEENIDF